MLRPVENPPPGKLPDPSCDHRQCEKPTMLQSENDRSIPNPDADLESPLRILNADTPVALCVAQVWNLVRGTLTPMSFPTEPETSG